MTIHHIDKPKAVIDVIDNREGGDDVYVNVTELCSNCNHDHVSQNLCLEGGTCKCSNGTGKEINKISTSAWMTVMKERYELVSLKGRKDSNGFDFTEFNESIEIKPTGALPTTKKRLVFPILLFIAIVGPVAYLTVHFATLDAPLNLERVLVIGFFLFLCFGFGISIWDEFFSPEVTSYCDKKYEAKYDIMKSQSKPPFF